MAGPKVFTNDMAVHMMSGSARKIQGRPENFDVNIHKFGSPKIFQYTETEKKRFGLDDEDFIENLYKKVGHVLRARDEEVRELVDELKPEYTTMYEKILYPQSTELDEFLDKKGIHKDPTKLVKIVNGEVVLNLVKRKKKPGSTVGGSTHGNSSAMTTYVNKTASKSRV